MRFGSAGSGITASLWSNDSSGTDDFPNASLTTFTTPTITSALANGYIRFTLDSPYELDQDTSYWIVVTATAREWNSPYQQSNGDEDSGGANSWSIDDDVIYRVSDTSPWLHVDASVNRGLQVQVEGYYQPGVVIEGVEEAFEENANDPLLSPFADQGNLVMDLSEQLDPPDADSTDHTTDYTVKLRSRPSTPVTVTPSFPAGITITPTSRTFTAGAMSNWDTAQTFTLTIPNDDDLEDNEYTVTHAVTGYGTITEGPSITVSAKETDSPSVTLSSNAVAVNEGSTDTYSFVLDKIPLNDVVRSRRRCRGAAT